LLATPTGIGIYDPDDGKQLLLAEIRDALAEQGGPGEIYFRNCFNGLRASVRFTFRRSGFSQEILLEQQLELPPGFSERSRLECYTVFAPNTPAPLQTTRVLRKEADFPRRARMVEPDLTDTHLDFGQMRIKLGKCFLSGAESRQHRVPVAKQWVLHDGAPVLIEAVEARAVLPLLAQLQAAVQPLERPILFGQRHSTRKAHDSAKGSGRRL
jgi:hypothetical protein